MVVGGRELIDTLWNVNQEKLALFLFSSLRINRYIMECKLQNQDGYFQLYNELIDTLWNVNFLAPVLFSAIPFEN